MGEDVNFFIRVSLAGETVVTGCVAAVYHRCDDESIMSRKSARARITPDFFRGVAPASLTGTTRAHARRFLFREYLKRAYQNRGIPLSRAEVTLSGCSLAPALSWRLGYLMVRYCPAPVMRTLVSLRKKL